MLFRFFYRKGLVIMKKIIAVAAALVLALTATLSFSGIVVSTQNASAAKIQKLSGEGGLDLGSITDSLGGVGDMLGGLDLGGRRDL